MTFPAEAQIAREIGKFVMNGALYRGDKPVMWSVVEKTALADAEVEYHDHKSVTATSASWSWKEDPALEGAAVIIWTTTWTMPVIVPSRPEKTSTMWLSRSEDMKNSLPDWAKSLRRG